MIGVYLLLATNFVAAVVGFALWLRSRNLLREAREESRAPISLDSASYSGDCLAVWNKTVSFLDDPKFLAAYRAGMASGQKIAGTYDVDLHIEWRTHVVCWAARQALAFDGDFVECGVNTGIFALAICNFLDFGAEKDRRFYLYDTFEGIPEEQISETEREMGRGVENKRIYEKLEGEGGREFFRVSQCRFG